MALITDPDLLNDGALDNGSTEVFINTTTKTIKLNSTGNLSADGVTIKALYSFLKEEWRNDPNTKNLAAFDFPMVPITDEFFEFVAGWDFFNDAARYLQRNGGWLVRNVSGAVTQHWAGIKTTGSTESNDQLYFQLDGTSGVGTATNFQQVGPVNHAVQIISDPNGDANYADGYSRTTNIKVFNREQGQRYSLSSTIANGESSLAAPKVFALDASTATDLKITHTDLEIDANSDGTADVAPYTGMSITYHATPQVRSIGGTNRNFGIIIDGNGGTAEQIYEFVQWSLRKSGDIDADASTLTGKLADELLEFVGDTLKTKNATNPDGGGTGVFIDDYQTVDINRLVFRDNTGAERTFPFVAALTLNFGDNLKNDASAKYFVYFSTLPGGGNDFGEAGALLVDDDLGADMTGTVGGASSITKSFNYDGNVQGGRTAGTDAAITVIGIGLATGQHVKATGVIGRSVSNSISLVASLERQYANL